MICLKCNNGLKKDVHIQNLFSKNKSLIFATIWSLCVFMHYDKIRTRAINREDIDMQDVYKIKTIEDAKNVKELLIDFPQSKASEEHARFILEHCENLERLEFLIVESHDISILANLKKLKHLKLLVKNVSDFSALGNLTSLTELDVHNCNIKDISFVRNMSKLKKLYLYGNDINDISDIAACKKLSLLNISSTNVGDISVVSQLEDLKELWIAETKVSDISCLEMCKKLQTLRIWDNVVNPFRVLMKIRGGCRNLKYVDLLDHLYYDHAEKYRNELYNFAFNPCKKTALVSLERSPSFLGVVKEVLTETEISEFFGKMFSDHCVTKRYLKQFIKERVMDGDEINYIGEFGGMKAKKMALEYELCSR